MVTDVKPVQPEKAEFPMLVTLSGMVMDVSIEQLSNAPYRMFPPVTVTLRNEDGMQ